MSRSGAALTLLALQAACLRVESNVRTERGPVLRTLERASTHPGGVSASLAVTWPRVDVTLTAYDTCRVEVLEEAIEETITERNAVATGPALSTGIANVLGAGVLFLSSLVVSGEPNFGVIDAQGRYGPSTRQYLQGSGWVTLGIGVPALAVGLVSLLRAGDEVQARPVQSVVSQREQRCGDRPFTGPVVLHTSSGNVVPLVAHEGAASFDVGQLKGRLVELAAFGRAVELDAASRGVLDALADCQAVARVWPASAPLPGLETSALETLAEQLRQCRSVDPSMTARIGLIDAALTVRHGAVEEADVQAEEVQTFDEAVKRYGPLRRWERGVSEEATAGVALRIIGVVATRTSTTCTIELGTRRVELELRDAPWASLATVGRRVEVVGVVASGSGAAWVVHPIFLRAAY